METTYLIEAKIMCLMLVEKVSVYVTDEKIKFKKKMDGYNMRPLINHDDIPD